MMNHIPLLAAAFWIINAAVSLFGQEIQPSKIIAGYVPDYRSYMNLNEDISELLTDVMLFSIAPTIDGGVDPSETCCLDSTHYANARKAKTYNKANNEEEYVAYIHLIIEASELLHQNRLLLSVALHPGQFLPKQVYNFVDRVHLMTYDMIHSNSHEPSTYNHHATYEKTVEAVYKFVESGCEPSKIILGIPCYGRHHKNPAMVKTVAELIEEVDIGNKYESQSLRSLNSFEGFLMDSPDLISQKVEFVFQLGLGGLFLWEIGQDYRSEEYKGGLLLQSAYGSMTSII